MRRRHFIYGAVYFIRDEVQSCLGAVIHACCRHAVFVIKNHYTAVGEQLRVVDQQPEEIRGTVVIVPVAGVTTVVQNRFSMRNHYRIRSLRSMFPLTKKTKKVEKRWEELHNGVRLVTLHSSYRSLVHPFDKF